MAITQNGGVYRLEGTDDQCGAGGGSASVIGTAFQNPSGTVGFGLNIVSTPSGEIDGLRDRARVRPAVE